MEYFGDVVIYLAITNENDKVSLHTASFNTRECDTDDIIGCIQAAVDCAAECYGVVHSVPIKSIEVITKETALQILNSMRFYELSVELDVEFETVTQFSKYFADQESMEEYAEMYLDSNKKEDGSYINNITDIRMEQQVVSYSSVRADCSADELEELLGFVI